MLTSLPSPTQPLLPSWGSWLWSQVPREVSYPPKCGASNHLLIPDPLGLTLGHRGFPCDLHPSVSPSSTFVPYADILSGSEYIKGNTATLPILFEELLLPYHFSATDCPLRFLGMERERVQPGSVLCGEDSETQPKGGQRGSHAGGPKAGQSNKLGAR